MPATETKVAHGSEHAQRYVNVETTFSEGGDLHVFLLHGGSMAAGPTPIHDGGIVIVDALDKETNSDTVVPRLTDDRYVCRVLKDDRFGRPLRSTNVACTADSPSAIPIDEVLELAGRIVRVVHELAWWLWTEVRRRKTRDDQSMQARQL